MTYEEVIRHFGTQVKLAAALGITQSTVSLWRRVIPDAYQCRLEILTAGALRVEPHLRIPANAESQQQTASHGGRGQMR